MSLIREFLNPSGPPYLTTNCHFSVMKNSFVFAAERERESGKSEGLIYKYLSGRLVSIKEHFFQTHQPMKIK